jgi:hypothetical protein
MLIHEEFKFETGTVFSFLATKFCFPPKNSCDVKLGDFVLSVMGMR